MGAFNVSVDDTSPLIRYNGEGWILHYQSEPNPDSFIQNYSGQTFHETPNKGSNASFEFFGTDIYIYGSLRSHHGEYSAYLDDKIVRKSAYAANPIFNTSLFAATGLDNAPHTFTIVNDAQNDVQRWVDIDSIVFTTGDSTSKSAYRLNTINSTSVNSPLKWSGNWTHHAYPHLGLDDTQQYSWTSGDAVTIPFQGSIIQIQGFTHPKAGQYSVSVDNAPERHFNASSPQWNSNSTLFFASGLSEGQHNLVFTNTGPNNTFVSVGLIQVTSEPSSTSLALEVTGATIFVFGILAVLALLSIFVRRRRRRRGSAMKQASLQPYLSMDPESGTQGQSSRAFEGTVYAGPSSRADVCSPEEVSMIRSAMRRASDAATFGSSRHSENHHDRDASAAPLLSDALNAPGYSMARTPSDVSLVEGVLKDDPPDYTSPKPSMRAQMPSRQKHPHRR